MTGYGQELQRRDSTNRPGDLTLQFMQGKGREFLNHPCRNDNVRCAHLNRSDTDRTSRVAFFSEKTGVKYPYAKYAQTVVRDFGGGMENITATTQTDNMIHDARTELDQTSDLLQSHELGASVVWRLPHMPNVGRSLVKRKFCCLFSDDVGRI